MTVIRSGGALTPLGDAGMSRAVNGWAGGGFSSLLDDYGSIWRTQPQIRKVVGFLARNIAQLNLTLYQRLSATDRERLDDHPLARAIRHPAGWEPAQKLSKTLFIESLVSDRAIYDNAYLWKLWQDDGELHLQRIPPTMIDPVGDELRGPVQYEIYGPERTITVGASDVVHFRGYNPADRCLGISPIESLRQILLEDLASDEYRQQLWNRGARISGVIERPAPAPGVTEWSEHARRRFREDWAAAWSGDGPEAGGTPVLEEGMTFKPTTFSARDAQWLEAKKLTREEVAAAYHVPQPVVGILDRATFSNVTELHKSVYQDLLPPWCVGIEEDLEQQLVCDWDDLIDSNAYVEFNLAEKLKGSFEEQARVLQTATGGPWLTRNEARARLNLPRIEDPGADQLIVPLNVLVGGQASPTDTAPPLAARDTVSRFLDRVQRTTLGRWHEARDGQRDIATVWQPERWSRELLQDFDAIGLEDAPELAAQLLEKTRSGVLDALAQPDPDRALAKYFADAERTADNLVMELTEEAA